MSLILDALRKSEAERRRGNLPALALELPPSPPSTAPARAWWLAAPIAFLLAALAFWMTRPADLPPPVQPTVVQAAEPTPDPQPVRAAHDPAAGAMAPAVTARAESTATREPMSMVPARVAATPAPAPGPAPAPAKETDETTGTSPAPTLALADLAPDERRALPPLKISMHMWSETPASRFVILDGHRLGEGDRAGSAVVERIDPGGVILAADGRRIRLPLP